MESHFPEMENTRLARERMIADLKALAGDAEALLRATANDAGDAAKEARARLMATVEKTKSTCEDLQARTIDSAKEAAKKADETIRAHPYESLAIAFGVGLLLGALLKRK